MTCFNMGFSLFNELLVGFRCRRLVALIYETFDTLGWFQRYKILQPEESSKNRASKLEVVRGVLVNHSMMVFFGWLDLALEPGVRSQRISDTLGITQAAMRVID